MSFCSVGNRNQGHVASETYLRRTAQHLRSNLQCWIANILGHGWMSTNSIYDCAQTGGLFYPLAHLRTNFESMLYHFILTGCEF